MKSVLNLTQHEASDSQIAAGVVDLAESDREALKALLTFERPPTTVDLLRRARGIAELAEEHGAEHVMIGGAPYLMSHTENALIDRAITPLYAFSRRESVEKKMPDGSVRKVGVFQHLGFVNSWGGGGHEDQ